MSLRARIFAGRAEDVLPKLPAECFDSVVTDPPYGLAELPRKRVEQAIAAWLAGDRMHVPDGRGFMGAEWDKFVPPPGIWDECYRLLKPGGYLLAFCAPRTYDLMGLSIRLAGFEVMDSIDWIFGSGFPKSLDVSKAIDKAAGAEREVLGRRTDGRYGSGFSDQAKRAQGAVAHDYSAGWVGDPTEITAPATEDAARWEGWGTALKPAHEPIVLARKPLAGTYVANVLVHGVGAMNVDGCRVAHASAADRAESEGKNRHADFGSGPREHNGVYAGMPAEDRAQYDGTAGRWPPNILLTHSAECVSLGMCEVRSNGHHPASRGPGGLGTSGHAGQDGLAERKGGTEEVAAWDCVPGCPVAGLDVQSGLQKSGTAVGGKGNAASIYGTSLQKAVAAESQGYGDTGGASRFFPQFAWDPAYDLPFLYCAKAPKKERPQVEGLPGHPTVKPLALMRWLVRLVTPPGGTVLEPFAGTGTTVQACLEEWFRCVAIERDPDSIQRIQVRLRGYADVGYRVMEPAPAEQEAG